MKQICHQKRKGFTLLEMLISVAVFALMAAMAYGGLSQVIRSSEQIKESNDTLAEVQFALSSIEKDLLQLSDRKIRDEFGDEQPALKIAQDRLTFSRLGWVNFIGAQRSHIQRVEYVVEENQLLRQYWTSLDQTIEQKPIQSILMTDIKGLSIKVIDADQKSHDTWPNTAALNTAPPLAKAIEVILELEKWGDVSKLIELVDAVQ